MRFFEYESRQILEREGIPVAGGGFATNAGGVKFADTPEECEAHAKEILALEIDGHMPRGVLVGAKAPIAHEYYAGVIYDGIAKKPTFVFSDMGGIDIEEVAEQHPEHIGRPPILSKLARLFVKYDMTLAEISPLVKLEDGSFMVVDAHMDMENEARPRQKALLAELGVGDDETREAREATPFE